MVQVSRSPGQNSVNPLMPFIINELEEMTNERGRFHKI